MTDKVGAIDEEYETKLEEHEKTLHKHANWSPVDLYKKLEEKNWIL